MDWVKLTTDYYRDFVVALGDDAAEVMFTRALALCGETESGGFVPDAMLHTLTRRPQHATRTAKYLTAPGVDREPVWERVKGGYQIINWHKHQEELERLVAKKRREKERKRKARAASADVSAPASADSPAPCPEDSLYESESKTQSKTAAAAAVGAAAVDLSTPIAILRDKLQAHTALQALRFDGLTPDKTTQLEQLISLHGDQRLVDTAVRTLRTPPPVHVSAFIGTWAALPEPGQVLKVVQSFCAAGVGHKQPLTPSGRCLQCETDAKVGEA